LRHRALGLVEVRRRIELRGVDHDGHLELVVAHLRHRDGQLLVALAHRERGRRQEAPGHLPGHVDLGGDVREAVGVDGSDPQVLAALLRTGAGRDRSEGGQREPDDPAADTPRPAPQAHRRTASQLPAGKTVTAPRTGR
jgi:hypothetical protein